MTSSEPSRAVTFWRQGPRGLNKMVFFSVASRRNSENYKHAPPMWSTHHNDVFLLQVKTTASNCLNPSRPECDRPITTIFSSCFSGITATKFCLSFRMKRLCQRSFLTLHCASLLRAISLRRRPGMLPGAGAVTPASPAAQKTRCCELQSEDQM